jgi:hypothetical protein
VQYGKILKKLAEGDFNPEELKNYQYINDWTADTTDNK